MKLNTKSQLGLLVAESDSYKMEMLTAQFNLCRSQNPDADESEIIQRIYNVIELIIDKEHPNQNYILRDTAMEMAKKIPLDETFDTKYLANLPTKKATFLVGKDLAFKYYKDDRAVYGAFYWTEGEGIFKSMNWSFFGITLEDGKIILPKETGTLQATMVQDDNPYSNENFTFFLKLLIFVELSELKIEVLPPNRKTGTRKEGKYINESKSNVTIVDSKWNVVGIRTEGFLVNGFWRNQPCGKGNQERKYIFVAPFQKHGYTRKRKMLNPNIENNG